MKEHDSLDALLREWKSPEPAPEMDRNLLEAYRAAVHPPVSFWRRFLSMRISIPVPALLAAAVAVAVVVLWLRHSERTAPPPESRGAVTQLNALGFQPLPDGEARIIPASEVAK